ncbi:DUF1178 family protein [Brucella pituitosa]|uniref:DUF1178 family protein n=1 Tax=Brucella pituitosa TaxID=571256 RepID=A0A643EVK7_9HYPH|nr:MULTISPECIES: DUF1178 family protein [Brucella]PQZ46418.1 DUF1178 domain-containing protein [Ochrobactrum sp. MYb19]PRA47267.1 DUF1178 domain-containing protein [Ochrobactrum sp. MYb68]PRA60392.1 DUF1178 domain-containing protein [Ochrobactrum sp. MYb18]PRA77618.1 DUF1178 domain-containing protein [Brucella thiophenivorans]PRA81703.1 DUF1178 domain-containing protein [Ochrobactrum sp. MYb29]PRA85013.1 DUF1178 domain-containing protein [Ochrobactrum sp. MYb14]PRA99628.1 DUF1178 domain-cont
MIRFSLHCDHGHEFEGWFRDNADFDRQAERKLVSCPSCGSLQVQKSLMAPAVSTSRSKEQVAIAMGEAQKQVLDEMRELSRKVRENADYVGDQFAEEARKIHFGETEARGIYGEASREDVHSLIEDGVDVMPLPVFPEDKN